MIEDTDAVVETPQMQAEFAAAVGQVTAELAGSEAEEAAAVPQMQKPIGEAKPAGEAQTAADEGKSSQRVALIMKREAQARRAAEEARAERARTAAEIERLERLKAETSRKPEPEPTVDDDELEQLLARKLGADAPDDLKFRARLAQRLRSKEQAYEQRLREIEERDAKRDEETKQFSARYEEQQREQQARTYLRTEVMPKFGDDLAGIRALAADEEFAQGLITPGLAAYREHHSRFQQGDEDEPATPERAFRPMQERLVRMTTLLMSDPAFAAVVQKALGAPKSKTTTAEEKKPALPPKTLSNTQHVTTTKLRAPGSKLSMQEEFDEAVEAVAADLARGNA